MNSQTMSSASSAVGAEADRSPVRADHDAGDDRRDDPGLVQAVGEDVRAVGGGERDRQLDREIVDEAMSREASQPPGEADGDAADDGDDDGRAPSPPSVTSPVIARDADDEQDERGAVVEQALALDERRSRRGAPRLPERRDARRPGPWPRPSRRRPCPARSGRPVATLQDDRHDRRGDEHAGRREEDHPAERPAQVPELQPERRLEHEAGHEDEEHQLRRDLDRAAAGAARRRPRPSATRATLYGIRSRRTTSAVTAATATSATKMRIASSVAAPAASVTRPPASPPDRTGPDVAEPHRCSPEGTAPNRTKYGLEPSRARSYGPEDDESCAAIVAGNPLRRTHHRSSSRKAKHGWARWL